MTRIEQDKNKSLGNTLTMNSLLHASNKTKKKNGESKGMKQEGQYRCVANWSFLSVTAGHL